MITNNEINYIPFVFLVILKHSKYAISKLHKESSEIPDVAK